MSDVEGTGVHAAASCPTGDEGDQAAAGSGAHALAGYDYQVDVSIWLALDLLLANRFAQSIELEPASEEDLEARLADREPGRLATALNADGYRLVVQAKRRSGDAWTVAGINALLKHGGKKRISAARRLAAPDVRYLLVTSAALNGGTRGLSVGRAGHWPRAETMPVSIVKALPADAAGRVGVIGNLDEDRLMGEVKRLLTERFGVPMSRWVACLAKLRIEARLRVTRQVGHGRWTREELAQVISDHDGYLANSPELKTYVFPSNWDALRAGMDGPRYAAVIIGQSGTGKTRATDKLHELLHAEMPTLTRVPVRHGPQQLRDDRTAPPVLYDIEDPWGRYDFDPASRPWNDQLSQILARATHDRRIIVTSRRDVAEASKAIGTVKDWIIPLEVEHYGPKERQQLYRRRIETLPRAVQLLAATSESDVLDELGSPLEIEKYFDALRVAARPDPTNPAASVKAAIRRAHEESIELTVAEQIRQRDDIAAAAVVWALLKANDKLSLRVIRALETDLAERHRRFEKGITPLVDFLAAARNLRVGDSDATYYHPRVEAGIAKALTQDAVPASLALRALIDLLTDPDASDPDWGAGVAARILAAIDRVPELAVMPRLATQRAIDGWIDRQFYDPQVLVTEHLRIAATAGSSASIGGEFARYLKSRPDGSFANILHWSAPDRTQAWYDCMRGAPETAVIASRFVREVLPEDRTSYGKTFVDDLERIAPDLTPAYLDGAAAIIGRGFDPVVETLAEGALRDLDGFAPVLDAAVAKLTPTQAERDAAAQQGLAFINGVYNDEYAEHVAGDDDMHTARELTGAYVDRVRAHGGWQSIAQHRHASVLLKEWMRSLSLEARNAGSPAMHEIAGAYAASHDTEYEDRAWYVLRLHWDPAYQTRLEARIRNGSDHPEVRTSALECLLVHSPGRFEQIVEDLSVSNEEERAVDLAIDLGLVLQYHAGNDDLLFSAAELARAELKPELAAISASARSLHYHGPAPVVLPAEAVQVLARTAGDRPHIRRLRIQHHAALGRMVARDIERTLSEATVGWEDDIACKEAIDAAVALALDDVVAGGLDHMFTSVIVSSLKAVGEPLAAPLPDSVLALAAARGKPVREALLDLLTAKPHRDHLPTVMTLVRDEWCASYRSHEEEADFPIARQAVAALHAMPTLPVEALEELDALAISTTDHELRLKLFELLAERGAMLFQGRLLDRACAPGRATVRRLAAHAMLAQQHALEQAIIDRIDAGMVATRIAGVASRLLLILSVRGSEQTLLHIGSELAGRSKRRAMVLLAVWATRDTRPGLAAELTQLLPAGHSVIAWLEAERRRPIDDPLVSDLGDPAVCTEVLGWLNFRLGP